jgi:hypothetical protein
MAAIYLHKLTVTVVTTECSPDVIERAIDKALGDLGMRSDARTDAENRQRGPAITIADAPEYPINLADRRAELAWATAHDSWLDSWPSVEDFK